MATDRSPRAWLLMAAGDDRQHGGNSGYDDQPDMYYSWDSTVNNSTNLRPGDVVALWDKRRLLGISVVEQIKPSAAVKDVYRCPNSDCGRASIKLRKTKSPQYRCQVCGEEFNLPASETVAVTKYISRHDAGWTSLEGVLLGHELRALAESPDSQLSMRALDWAAFRAALEAKGEERAVQRVIGRAPELHSSIELHRSLPGATQVEYPQGHTLAMVRVRRGQQGFRERLLRTQGGTCAFTGTAPERVLDAGHLYSYAALGEHHEHGGLLLRRDVHRLFDDGWLAVEPGSLKVDVSERLQDYPQYARLHDKSLAVNLHSEQQSWLEKHWAEHRG